VSFCHEKVTDQFDEAQLDGDRKMLTLNPVSLPPMLFVAVPTGPGPS
jgi:hypothetical protein